MILFPSYLVWLFVMKLFIVLIGELYLAKLLERLAVILIVDHHQKLKFTFMPRGLFAGSIMNIVVPAARLNQKCAAIGFSSL